MVMMDRMENTNFDKDRLEIKVMDREGVIFMYGQEEEREHHNRVRNLNICDRSLEKQDIGKEQPHSQLFETFQDSLQQE